jgi:hypothetical protein
MVKTHKIVLIILHYFRIDAPDCYYHQNNISIIVRSCNQTAKYLINHAQVKFLRRNVHNVHPIHIFRVATPRGSPITIIHQQKHIRSCFCESNPTNSSIQVSRYLTELSKYLLRRNDTRHVYRSIVALRSHGRFDTSRAATARRVCEGKHVE